MPENPIDEKSTLVQVMDWCRQATSHYLNHCWQRSAEPYGITMNQDIGTRSVGILLCMRPANERRRYIVTSPPIGWAHTRNDTWKCSKYLKHHAASEKVLPFWACSPWVNEVISSWTNTAAIPGVYTKFSGRLSEEPFPWLIQKFPCLLIFKTGQPGCQLNLSEGQIRLDLTSGRPLV